MVLAGCVPSPDLQNPPVLLQEITAGPGFTSHPTTTAAPGPEHAQATASPIPGAEGRLTAETFAADVGAAITGKGSVHIETMEDKRFRSTTAEADYVFSSDAATPEGGGNGIVLTFPFDQLGEVRYILTKDAAFANLGEQTDNKYYALENSDTYPALENGWSNPQLVSIKPTVDRLLIDSNVRELEGNISSFALVSGPVNIRGVQAYEYAVTVPSAAVSKQLGITAWTEIRKGLEPLSGDPTVDTVTDQVDYLLTNLPASVEFHYWIGPGCLPVKVTYELLGSTSETILSKWGDVGPVVAPSDEQYGGILDE